MAIWKVSYVVKGSDHPGGIVNLDHSPTQGELLQFGNNKLEVLEVFELMPSKREFHYIHATCRLIEPTE